MLAGAGLYVHYPWCVRKCPYCDFNSHPLKPESDFVGYTDALLADLAQQLRQLPDDLTFSSVFMGGGTPSLCPAEEIGRLLAATPLAKDAEITMEANPGTTEHMDFSAFRHAGVNRLSLGSQSFDAQQLQKLGRIHGPEETVVAFAEAREGGFDNINLDLMWGLPQQSQAAALDDLSQAIALQPEHISWYQLTIEAKTEFARRPPQLPDEDRLATIEETGVALLAEHGFARYEVSAYSQADKQCAHNLNYWRFGDYLGIGAGAHGKRSTLDAGINAITRTSKPRQPRLFLAEPTSTTAEMIENNARTCEFMLNALRLAGGVDTETFTARTGLSWDAVAPVWQRLAEVGLVEPDRCTTTPLGFRYLDSVVAEFLDVSA